MTPQILLLLIAIGLSLILFSLEKIPADVIALGLLLFITITGLLPVDQAFLGFGSNVVLMIMGLLILTAALSRTGVVDIIGRYLFRFIGNNHSWIVFFVMLAASVLSTFISNTAATAFLVPITIGIARKIRMSSSRILMPLAFGSILSSSMTLVATTTNILVSGLMTRYGLKPLGMFELTPVGFVIVIFGIIYMAMIGYRWVPERNNIEDEPEKTSSLHYLSELVILPGSKLANKTLGESNLGQENDLIVVRVLRKKRRYLAPRADLVLAEGDVLLVKGKKDHILSIKNVAGIDLKPDRDLSIYNLQSQDVGLVEVILLLGSPLIGRTLKGMEFRERYGLQVLAIHRHGETIDFKLSSTRFQLGDVLLIQGHRSNIAALEADKTFRVISLMDRKFPKLRRAPIAIAAFVGSLAVAALGWLPITVAVLLGVLVVFITRCITPQEAYRELEWRIIILIGCLLGVGSAMEYTGAAEFLASQIVAWMGNSHPFWLLAGFFVLTMMLTQPMSNQAAAAIVLPVAIQTAIGMGVNPRTFAVMIAIGASCSFLTPLEPSCLIVYGLGNYRFLDFLKVGSLLSLIIFIIAILLVPVLWPL